LLIIDELRHHLSYCIKDGEYFDIDGQSNIIINFLKDTYAAINPGKEKPALHLTFLWNAQEGEEDVFRPFCMKFRSPNFTMSSTPRVGLSQSGSGSSDARYKAIASFLSGEYSDSVEFKSMFSNTLESANLWTVKIFKNMLFNEAANIDFPGVSKSFISFESVIGYDKIFPEALQEKLTEAFKAVGVSYSTVKSSNHCYNQVTLDPDTIQKAVKRLWKEDLKAAIKVRKTLIEGLETMDLSSTHTLPTVEVDYIYAEEAVHTPYLITTWEEMREFLSSNDIDMKACTATA